MIIKDIDLKDIKELTNLYKDNYNPNISKFTHIYAYYKDEFISFIVFDIIYERCEIIDVFTRKDKRNNKLASTLINEIINDYNIINITLEVKIDNISAIKLYESLGFKKVSIRKGYYNGVDGLLMVKEVR